MITVGPATLADASQVLALYRAVAAMPNGGLARGPDEYDLAHIEALLAKCANGGVALLARDKDALVGTIDAMRIGPRQFAHALSDITVAVHPSAQGRGVGRALFAALFDAAAALTPKVTRFELMVREGNRDAVRLYERLGFRIEGRYEGRVALPDGTLEADIAMGRLL
jgi:putative acetyltransferase